MAWAAKEASAKSVMALAALPLDGVELAGKVDTRGVAGFVPRQMLQQNRQ